MGPDTLMQWRVLSALSPFARPCVASSHASREAKQRAWWLNNLRMAKERMRKGELPSDTWAYRYLEQVQREGNPNMDQEEEQEMFASCMIGFLNLVGVVTISGPLKFFQMAMGLHPEWQKKAQDEIDRVCGDRMPTMKDFADLPTVRACLKETVRWRSGVPLGTSTMRHDSQSGHK